MGVTWQPERKHRTEPKGNRNNPRNGCEFKPKLNKKLIYPWSNRRNGTSINQRQDAKKMIIQRITKTS